MATEGRGFKSMNEKKHRDHMSQAAGRSSSGRSRVRQASKRGGHRSSHSNDG